MSEATQTLRPAASAVAHPESERVRPPYLWAGVAAVLVFALYAFTLAPTTAFWDTSEYITTAHILGIPHPPGNPLFVLLARAWELLISPLGLSVAVEINTFSALMGALSALFFFLVTHRVLCFFTPSERIRCLGAGAGVLISATAFTVWNQSNVNEKVYTVSMLTIAALSWLAFLWREHTEAHVGKKGRWHDDNVLVLMAYLLALSVANHLMAFLAAPALLVFVLLVKPRALASWRLYAFALVFGVLGLSANLFLPIRAGQLPIINEAEPTCFTAESAGQAQKETDIGASLISVLTLGNAGCENLSASLKREQYQKPPLSERQAPFWAQMANYAQYFDWQWSRSLQGAQGYFAPARMPFTLLFLGLGLFGAWHHWKRDRKSFAYLGVLFFTLSVGLTIYMNFRYGFMQAPALGLDQNQVSEVRERDYFFLVSFALWGLWCGIGLVAAYLEAAVTLRSPGARTAVAVGLGAIAFLPMALNWSYASRRGDYAARDWAYNLLQSVEPYGILFTNGDNDTFPLWYLQEVEGIRRDVTVIVSSYLNTDWYARQLRDLTRPCPTPNAWAQDETRIICQRPYQHDPRFPFYAGATAPTKSILPLTDDQIRGVTGPGYYFLPAEMSFEARGVQTTLPAGKPLLAAEQFALQMIKDAWGDRPVYFATTTGLHLDLNLGQHVVRQGLALKLTTPDERAGFTAVPQRPDLIATYGAYIDKERTRLLADSLFVTRDLINQSRWADDATRGIPSYFGVVQSALGAAESLEGNEAEAMRRNAIAEQWFAAARR